MVVAAILFHLVLGSFGIVLSNFHWRCLFYRIFPYGCLLIFYLLVSYTAACFLLLELSCIAVRCPILCRYNRGSIFRYSFYVCRCWFRDLWAGHRPMPHCLPVYMLLCFAWTVYCEFLSGSLHFMSILLFVIRWSLRGRHFLIYCRPMSMLSVLLFGYIAEIAEPILFTAFLCETLYPSMGDEESEAETVLSTMGDSHPGFADRNHPGYVGQRRLLDRTWCMAADGLCLYHALVCAADYDLSSSINGCTGGLGREAP